MICCYIGQSRQFPLKNLASCQTKFSCRPSIEPMLKYETLPKLHTTALGSHTQPVLGRNRSVLPEKSPGLRSATGLPRQPRRPLLRQAWYSHMGATSSHRFPSRPTAQQPYGNGQSSSSQSNYSNRGTYSSGSSYGDPNPHSYNQGYSNYQPGYSNYQPITPITARITPIPAELLHLPPELLQQPAHLQLQPTSPPGPGHGSHPYAQPPATAEPQATPPASPITPFPAIIPAPATADRRTPPLGRQIPHALPWHCGFSPRQAFTSLWVSPAWPSAAIDANLSY